MVHLYEMLGSLRSDLMQVEAIVSLYNGIHVTLQDEEWPLIQSAVEVRAFSWTLPTTATTTSTLFSCCILYCNFSTQKRKMFKER